MRLPRKTSLSLQRPLKKVTDEGCRCHHGSGFSFTSYSLGDLCHGLVLGMRWVILIFFAAWIIAQGQSKCIVSDFYALSWLGDPTVRHMQLSRWLTTNGDSCSSEQLVLIWNQWPVWAGVADSQELRGKILYFHARAVEREKK